MLPGQAQSYADTDLWIKSEAPVSLRWDESEVFHAGSQRSPGEFISRHPQQQQALYVAALPSMSHFPTLPRFSLYHLSDGSVVFKSSSQNLLLGKFRLTLWH